MLMQLTTMEIQTLIIILVGWLLFSSLYFYDD